MKETAKKPQWLYSLKENIDLIHKNRFEVSKTDKANLMEANGNHVLFDHWSIERRKWLMILRFCEIDPDTWHYSGRTWSNDDEPEIREIMNQCHSMATSPRRWLGSQLNRIGIKTKTSIIKSQGEERDQSFTSIASTKIPQAWSTGMNSVAA